MPSCGRIPSRTFSHEPEDLHNNSQRNLWSSSAVPCVTNFPWLAGRNRRLDSADVVKLDRSRRRRRLELLRNKPRHAWLVQRRSARITKQALIGAVKKDRYSITSSARASTEGGIVRPRALAVLRLITKSNLDGCSTGKSAGLAPFNILSTKVAALRNKSEISAP